MKRRAWIFPILLAVTSALFHGERFRRDSPAPMAHGIVVPINEDGPRRMPVSDALLKAIGPIAIGKKDGDDIKWDVPNFGTVGMGNGKTQIMKFIPAGTEGQKANGGTWKLGDRPDLGYMEHDSTIGRASGSESRVSLAGLGSFITENNNEKGTGLLDFSKALFPFLELPPPKSEEKHPHSILSTEEQRLAELYYPKPRSYVDGVDEATAKPATPFEDDLSAKRVPTYEDDASVGNPFDQIKSRPGYARFRVHAAKTAQLEDTDMLPTKPDSPFDSEDGVVVKDKEGTLTDVKDAEKKAKTLGVAIPISQLGLSDPQVYKLCERFAPVAAKYCYGNKIEPQYLDRCRGYMTDCRKFQAEAKPLGAIANAWNSGVGLTYYDWGVKGIPFYPVNEEGAIGNGIHGKVDFGTWGGGYSDEVGVRDFISQTQEYGANWYEGMYGWKRGWNIPIVQSLGVEGASGTQVHVPIKEGEFGRPLQITNGYSVGPYFGLADKTNIDWFNGGVSSQRGFAVPFVGVGVSSGVGVGFPSIGTMMNKMGLNALQATELARASQSFDSTIGLSGGSESVVSASKGGSSLFSNLNSLSRTRL